jgi:hypothetical protein
MLSNAVAGHSSASPPFAGIAKTGLAFQPQIEPYTVANEIISANGPLASRAAPRKVA